jgi:hypothetical protein
MDKCKWDIHTCAYIHVHTYMCIYTCTHTHQCIRLCTHKYTHTLQMKECKWVRVNHEIAQPPQHTYQTDIDFMKHLRDEVHIRVSVHVYVHMCQTDITFMKHLRDEVYMCICTCGLARMCMYMYARRTWTS